MVVWCSRLFVWFYYHILINIFQTFLIKKESIQDDRFKYIVYILSGLMIVGGIVANIYLWQAIVIIPSSQWYVKGGEKNYFIREFHIFILPLSFFLSFFKKISWMKAVIIVPSSQLYVMWRVLYFSFLSFFQIIVNESVYIFRRGKNWKTMNIAMIITDFF